MVVRFDLENRRQPVANVDGASILAWSLQHLRPVSRQRPQMHTRAFVAAVLRPHHRENAQFRQIRLTTEKLHDALVFIALQAVAFDGGGINAHAVANAFTIDSRITRPSTQPNAGSAARSGCGIMPTTLRRKLQTPAIA